MRLSDSLYSDQTHFILELIQNADDNTYEDGILPTLQFRLFRAKLIVQCNEFGFTKDDVQAICRVDDSKKKGRKTIDFGCIGEKGIGAAQNHKALAHYVRIQVRIFGVR